jgi:hypothetical protein
MKRRISHRRRGSRAYDIKKDLSSPLLAALGAVALAWNDVEAMIDLLIPHSPDGTMFCGAMGLIMV